MHTHDPQMHTNKPHTHTHTHKHSVCTLNPWRYFSFPNSLKNHCQCAMHPAACNRSLLSMTLFSLFLENFCLVLLHMCVHVRGREKVRQFPLVCVLRWPLQGLWLSESWHIVASPSTVLSSTREAFNHHTCHAWPIHISHSCLSENLRRVCCDIWGSPGVCAGSHSFQPVLWCCDSNSHRWSPEEGGGCELYFILTLSSLVIEGR